MRKVIVGLGAAVLLTAGTAFAQGQPGSLASGGTPPGGFPVGPLTVYPTIDLAYGYDDNLFQRPTNPTTSTFTNVHANVRAEAKTGPHKYDFGVRMSDSRYHDSPADNYTDYNFFANADLVFSARAGLKLNADYRQGHDARGTTDRAVAAAPDVYDSINVGGLFSYGAPGARGRIDVEGRLNTIRYTNNRATTEVSDHDTTLVGGTFFWRVAPRTELLTQLTQSEVSYPLATSTLDSTETRFLVGAKWEATAATTGTAKFGRQRKQFDSAARQSFSDSSWDVGVRWSPLTYSVFDFYTSKQASESTGVGDATVGKIYGAAWNHAWTSVLRTQMFASLRNDDFQGAGVTRNDDTTTFGLKVAYEFRRWLRLGAEFTHSERDSNDSNLNFKKNLLLFTVGATL